MPVYVYHMPQDFRLPLQINNLSSEYDFLSIHPYLYILL